MYKGRKVLYMHQVTQISGAAEARHLFPKDSIKIQTFNLISLTWITLRLNNIFFLNLLSICLPEIGPHHQVAQQHPSYRWNRWWWAPWFYLLHCSHLQSVMIPEMNTVTDNYCACSTDQTGDSDLHGFICCTVVICSQWWYLRWTQ